MMAMTQTAEDDNVDKEIEEESKDENKASM